MVDPLRLTLVTSLYFLRFIFWWNATSPLSDVPPVRLSFTRKKKEEQNFGMEKTFDLL